MFSPSRSRDKFLFDISNYKIVRKIDSGGFEIIHLVQNKKTGEEFVTKTNINQSKLQSKLFISREICILIKVQHPTIVKFHGFSYVDFDKKDNITILMDFMKRGSLAQLIDQEQKGFCPIENDVTKRQIILVGVARNKMLLHKHTL